ncbi:hypothetical protein BT67DRAFT_92940 [Trichocladium antarcticum]|uniref:Uncharacterized protein n=1 Tax=Trichocladium antarcticum TaxID=1450529 RepID=A0AAN6UGG2_9PEZI|nr:hypothetical protein BT67DRAFT_92940 [Trichocladium antarcticum]
MMRSQPGRHQHVKPGNALEWSSKSRFPRHANSQARSFRARPVSLPLSLHPALANAAWLASRPAVRRQTPKCRHPDRQPACCSGPTVDLCCRNHCPRCLDADACSYHSSAYVCSPSRSGVPRDPPPTPARPADPPRGRRMGPGPPGRTRNSPAAWAGRLSGESSPCRPPVPPKARHGLAW